MKTKTVAKQAKSAKALNAQQAAKRLANTAKPQTISAQAASASVQAANVKTQVQVPKKAGRTLYAFYMGNGDGVSMFGRMFYFALYAIQIKGSNPLKGEFPSGQQFRMYPGFNSAYWKAKSVMASHKDGGLMFTPEGAAMLKSYPIEDAKTFEAIKAAILSGKPKDTGRDNQKMFAFQVPA